MKSTLCIAVVTATVVFAGAVSPASATPISYQITTTQSGTIGTKSFSNATVTVDVTGDTSTIGSLGGLFLYNPVTGSVDISGVGTYSFTGPIEMASTANTVVSGFESTSAVLLAQLDAPGTDPGQFTGIAGTFDTSLYGYNLQSADVASGQWTTSNVATSGQFLTTGGLLHFTSSGGSSTFTATGGNGTTTTAPGGPLDTPTTLQSNTLQVFGNIGGVGSAEFYRFFWGGGLFSATAAVGTTDPADSYAFNLYTDGLSLLVADTLNSANHFGQTLSLALAPGFYDIGLQTITDPPADPSFAITFGTAVNPVPEPATLTLTALGLAAAIRRRHGRSGRMS